MFDFLDAAAIVRGAGLIGIWAIIFAESGLLIGFFLPGDTLLFTAGYLASLGYLPLSYLILGCFLAAVVGDNVGYWFGKKVGPRIFTREDSRLFRRSHIERSRHFYERYGRSTIVIARFFPIVRTFAPILAGVGHMEYRTFFTYNIVGAFLWTVSMTLFGFYVGRILPNGNRYLTVVITIILILSVLPAIWKFLKRRHLKREGGSTV